MEDTDRSIKSVVYPTNGQSIPGSYYLAEDGYPYKTTDHQINSNIHTFSDNYFIPQILIPVFIDVFKNVLLKNAPEEIEQELIQAMNTTNHHNMVILLNDNKNVITLQEIYLAFYTWLHQYNIDLNKLRFCNYFDVRINVAIRYIETLLHSQHTDSLAEIIFNIYKTLRSQYCSPEHSSISALTLKNTHRYPQKTDAICYDSPLKNRVTELPKTSPQKRSFSSSDDEMDTSEGQETSDFFVKKQKTQE